MHVAFHSSRGYDCTLMVLSLKGPGFSQLLLRLVKKPERATALKKQVFVVTMKSHFHHCNSIQIAVSYVTFRKFLFPPFSCIFPIWKCGEGKSALVFWFDDSIRSNGNAESSSKIRLFMVNSHLTSMAIHRLQCL